MAKAHPKRGAIPDMHNDGHGTQKFRNWKSVNDRPRHHEKIQGVGNHLG